MKKIPLAWLNLINKPRRFFVTLAGISSAVILMFIEFGFQNAMYDSQMSVVRALNTDLLVLARSSYSISVDQKFPLARLATIRAVDGIEKVVPLYIESRRFKIRNPQTGRRHPIRVLAFDLSDPVFLNNFLKLDTSPDRALDTALFDLRSRRSFGDFTPGTETEIGNRKFTITGSFSLGTDFVNDGNLLMSHRSYFRLFPDLRDDVAIGLIRLKPGQNSSDIQTAIRQIIPKDISILSKQQALAQEMNYWNRSTYIGFIFGMGTMVGFIVGVTVCSQILYAGVVDYLPQFATLKAIGYSDGYLVGTVLRQAVVLALLGFVPGLVSSLLLYDLVVSLTGLPMEMTVPRVFLIFVLTVGMCALSASMAIRKILYTDPAEVFK